MVKRFFARVAPQPAGASLTVDATAAFGTCSAPDNPPYCGGDAHAQPDPNFVAGRGVDQPQGTETTDLCWQYGGNVEAPASGDNSTVWIETTLSPDPWMNVLYFPPGAADGLTSRHPRLTGKSKLRKKRANTEPMIEPSQ